MQVLLAYIELEDIPGLAEKVQTFYSQIVVSETHSIIRNLLFEVRAWMESLYHSITGIYWLLLVSETSTSLFH